MNQKPGWTYIYSEELKQHIARHDASGWVYCEDGTKYSPKEIQIIIKNHKLMSAKAHLIKKVFDGEIIQ
jgi:hypothetical protein